MIIVVWFLSINGIMLLQGILESNASWYIPLTFWNLIAGVGFGLMTKDDKLKDESPIFLGAMFSAPLSFLVRKISVSGFVNWFNRL